MKNHHKLHQQTQFYESMIYLFNFRFVMHLVYLKDPLEFFQILIKRKIDAINSVQRLTVHIMRKELSSTIKI